MVDELAQDPMSRKPTAPPFVQVYNDDFKERERESQDRFSKVSKSGMIATQINKYLSLSL